MRVKLRARVAAATVTLVGIAVLPAVMHRLGDDDTTAVILRPASVTEPAAVIAPGRNDEPSQTPDADEKPPSTIPLDLPVLKPAPEIPSLEQLLAAETWPAASASHTDEFESDTRRRYGISGAIGWERGRVTLEQGAALHLKRPSGPIVELTVTIDDTTPTSKDTDTGILFAFIIPPSNAATVQITAAGPQSLSKSTLAVIYRRFGPNGKVTNSQVVRQQALSTNDIKGQWRIRYRHGLIQTHHDGDLAAIAQVSNRSTVAGARIAQVCGRTRISRLEYRAFAPAPNLYSEKNEKLQEIAFEMDAASQGRRNGDLTKALAAAKRAVRICRDVRGEDHVATATTLRELGRCQIAAKRYREAEACQRMALAIFQKHSGPVHGGTADCHLWLGEALYEQAKLGEAKRHFLWASKIYEFVAGEDHPRTAAAIDGLGRIAGNLGDYAAARRQFERALRIRQLSNPQSPSIIGSLLHLGVFLGNQGDLLAARPYLEEARLRCEKQLGERSPQTALCLENLAELSVRQGDVAAARSLIEKAIQIRQQAGERESREFTTSLNQSGLMQLSERNYAEARQCFEEALDINMRLGETHPGTARTHSHLGRLLVRQQEYASAVPHFQKTLELYQEIHGDRHHNSLRAKLDLGESLGLGGDLSAAQRQFENALAISRQVYGRGHPRTRMPLFSLSRNLFAQGQTALAWQRLEEAHRMQVALSRDLLPTFSEAEMLAHVARSPRTGLALSILAELPQVDHADAYRVVWDTRAMASRAMAARKSVVACERDEVRWLWEELQAVRKRLAATTLAPPKRGKEEARRELLLGLTRQKEGLERELARASVPFSNEQESQKATVRYLARLLPTDAVLIEFVWSVLWQPPRSGRDEWTYTPQYEAFVVRKTDTPSGFSAVWVHVGQARPIDEAVRHWREALAPTDVADNSVVADSNGDSPANSLRQLVWDKISPHLPGCATVVIIPAGSLARVPWAALPGNKPNSYLIEEYSIATAGYGQQLCGLLQRPRPSGNQLLAVGGVAYDDAFRQATDDTLALAYRSPVEDIYSRTKWVSLPSTSHEAHAIVERWQESGHCVLLQKAKATEFALRSEMPKSRYVHLATHGFFAGRKLRSMLQPDEDIDNTQVFSGTSDDPRLLARRNPLVLSGVVLAGANIPPRTNHWGAPIGDDGILTAEEVVDLDLQNTELVVLSACETGLGEVAGGEGVFGLQRAFHLAGARTVVASQWKVDDAATRVLMELFYRNLWETKMSKLEALRQAQLTMIVGYSPREGHLRGAGRVVRVSPAELDKARKQSKTDLLPPFYWAGFTLSGDWR